MQHRAALTRPCSTFWRVLSRNLLMIKGSMLGRKHTISQQSREAACADCRLKRQEVRC